MTDTKKVRRYPHWAYPSQRAFRAKKRADIRALAKALNQMRMGCAYIPGGVSLVESIDKAVCDLQRIASVKEWGR